MSSSNIAWIGSMQYALIFLPAILSLVIEALISASFLIAQCTKYWEFVLVEGTPLFRTCEMCFGSAIGVIRHWFNQKRGGTALPIIARQLIPRLGPFLCILISCSFQWTMKIIGFLLLLIMGVANIVLPPKRVAGGIFNFAALKSPVFVIYCFSALTAFLGMYTGVMFLLQELNMTLEPFATLTFIDISAVAAGVPEDFSFYRVLELYLVSIANACFGVGRLVSGLVTTNCRQDWYMIVNTCSVAAALVTFLRFLAHTANSLVVVAVLYGYYVDSSVRSTQALIITSTRELASAVQNIVIALGIHMDIECHACIVGEETTKLQNAQIVIGTPGRVYDLVKRRAISSDKIKLLCIDEADDILSRGFKNHIYDVFHFLPQELQVILFSGTMPADVLEVSQKFMSNPVRILQAKKDEPSLEGIKQYYIAIEREEWKLDTVCDLFDNLAVAQVIIFCNTRRKVDWLHEKMHARKYTHADMDQKCHVLARRLNVPGSSLGSPPVINYDIPASKENYIYRLDRGSYGGGIVVINFVTTDDVRTLRDIEQYYNTQIDEMPLNVADLL
ncbi:ATP-dependent RNA helicase eIF4A [Termitomyces sp. J132]|nr:ATP-dependent RNA helicase eIF4A [Termitomyces sp. J132]